MAGQLVERAQEPKRLETVPARLQVQGTEVWNEEYYLVSARYRPAELGSAAGVFPRSFAELFPVVVLLRALGGPLRTTIGTNRSKWSINYVWPA